MTRLPGRATRTAAGLAVVMIILGGCGPAAVTPPPATTRPPLSAEVSFGGHVDELCLAVASSPSLPGSAFVVRVLPSDGLLEPSTQDGILDGQGAAHLGWKLESEQEASWTITVDVTAPDGSVKHLETAAGADQTGNPRNEATPACARTEG